MFAPLSLLINGRLVLLWVLASAVSVLRCGVGAGASLVYYLPVSIAIENQGLYDVDPLMSEFLPATASALLVAVAELFHVPGVHLVGGILIKLAISAGLVFLCWTITRSYTACAIGMLMFFVTTPLGLMAHEIRSPLYLSFRQASMALVLVSSAFLFRGRPLTSSVLMVIAFYIHPKNMLATMLAFSTALRLYTIYAWNDSDQRISRVKSLLRFAAPFGLGMVPYVASMLGLLAEVTPISIASFGASASRTNRMTHHCSG